MKNGLLFYNGRFNDRNDFMALEIVDGQVQFSFSTGTNKTSVRSKVEGGLANGEWQFVQVDYLNRVSNHKNDWTGPFFGSGHLDVKVPSFLKNNSRDLLVVVLVQ